MPTVTDSFHRAAGDLGPNWTAFANGSDLSISARVNPFDGIQGELNTSGDPAGSGGIAYWSAASFGTSQSAEMNFSETLRTTIDAGVAINVQNVSQDPVTHAITATAYAATNNTGTTSLLRYDNTLVSGYPFGSGVVVATFPYAIVPASISYIGDLLMISRSGDTITVSVNGATQITYVDPSPLPDLGAPGIIIGATGGGPLPPNSQWNFWQGSSP